MSLHLSYGGTGTASVLTTKTDAKDLRIYRASDDPDRLFVGKANGQTTEIGNFWEKENENIFSFANIGFGVTNPTEAIELGNGKILKIDKGYIAFDSLGLYVTDKKFLNYPGNYNVVMGVGATENATGLSFSNVFGFNAGREFSSDSVNINAFGRFAAGQVEYSRDCNFFGFQSGQLANNPQYSNYFGRKAGLRSSGLRNNYYGDNVAIYHRGNDNVVIGGNQIGFVHFDTYEVTNTAPAINEITLSTNHDVGVGQKMFCQFVGQTPNGIIENDIRRFEATSANTIVIDGALNGNGTSYTVRIQKQINNSVSIGKGAYYYREKQVIIGSNSNNEILLSGNVGVGFLNQDAPPQEALHVKGRILQEQKSVYATSTEFAVFNESGILGYRNVDFDSLVDNGANLGGGVNIFSSKNGSNLEFKSVASGSGINVSNAGSTISVDNTTNDISFFDFDVNNAGFYLTTATKRLSGAVVTAVAKDFHFHNSAGAPTFSNYARWAGNTEGKIYFRTGSNWSEVGSKAISEEDKVNTATRVHSFGKWTQNHSDTYRVQSTLINLRSNDNLSGYYLSNGLSYMYNSGFTQIGAYGDKVYIGLNSTDTLDIFKQNSTPIVGQVLKAVSVSGSTASLELSNAGVSYTTNVEYDTGKTRNSQPIFAQEKPYTPASLANGQTWSTNIASTPLELIDLKLSFKIGGVRYAGQSVYRIGTSTNRVFVTIFNNLASVTNSSGSAITDIRLYAEYTK